MPAAMWGLRVLFRELELERASTRWRRLAKVHAFAFAWGLLLGIGFRPVLFGLGLYSFTLFLVILWTLFGVSRTLYEVLREKYGARVVAALTHRAS